MILIDFVKKKFANGQKIIRDQFIKYIMACLNTSILIILAAIGDRTLDWEKGCTLSE